MKKQYFDDIIITKRKSVDGRVEHIVVLIQENVEVKDARIIAKTISRCLPSAYYCASIGPGQYQVGSVFYAKS